MTRTRFTKLMLDFANTRHRPQGFDMRLYTAHKVAHELMRWDQEFMDADYVSLVAAVANWQREQA